MAKGSCMCGEYTYEISEGDVGGNAICHCEPCRKTAGSNGSVNSFVPNDKFKRLSGTAKTWTRKGISGKDVEYTFCSNCCTLISVDAESMAGMTIVKPGTIDDSSVMESLKPGLEIFTKERISWVKPTEGTEQKEVA
nr:hypothetical protein CFP56_16929 [Quercus suber]